MEKDNEHEGRDSGCDTASCYAKKVNKYFKAYKNHTHSQNYYISKRSEGRFGILCSNDEWAVKFRKHCKAVEITEAFLEGRKPNPACF